MQNILHWENYYYYMYMYEFFNLIIKLGTQMSFLTPQNLKKKNDHIFPTSIMTISKIANRQKVIVLDMCIQRGVTYVNY